MTDSITPWDVVETEIDYDKLINQFGCEKIENNLIEKIEKITGKKAHHLLRRGIVFAHRDLNVVLEKFINNEKFYIYTGRGPSTRSLHIGHSIPFLLCKYLQDAFNVPVVIQITDDEKFLFKNLNIDESIYFAKENIKDIIAFGFNPEKTFIFKNVDIYDGIISESAEKNRIVNEGLNEFFQKELILSKEISLHEAIKIFGFNQSSNLGQLTFPVRQILPCFYKSFSFLKESVCLVPAAIDQDPYFRLARDKAKIFNCMKPSTIYSGFLPSLSNLGKMSSSAERTIFLDNSFDEIHFKIHKYAFSGGRDTLKEHRLEGGNTEKDTSFQYLRYFLENDEELKELEINYKKGLLTSKEMKNKCIEEIYKFIKQFQDNRAKITDQLVQRFLSHKKNFYC